MATLELNFICIYSTQNKKLRKRAKVIYNFSTKEVIILRKMRINFITSWFYTNLSILKFKEKIFYLLCVRKFSVESGLNIADKSSSKHREDWKAISCHLEKFFYYPRFIVIFRFWSHLAYVKHKIEKLTRKRNEINLDILNQLQCVDKKFTLFYWNSML